MKKKEFIKLNENDTIYYRNKSWTITNVTVTKKNWLGQRQEIIIDLQDSSGNTLYISSSHHPDVVEGL